MSSSDSSQFAECTTKEEAIQLYLQCLDEIKADACKEYGIESHEFVKMFRSAFHGERDRTTPISTPHSKRINGKEREIRQFSVCAINARHIMNIVYSQLRQYMVHIVFVAIVLILVNYRFELTKLFMRNIQVYIYPGMRFWRQLTMPIIRQFPQLTQFYDETCLVSNPFFRVANLDCSPCADVINVVDLSITPEFGYLGSNIPHIIQQADGVNQSVAAIYQLYQQNREMFREEADRVRSTHRNVANLDQMFDVLLNLSGKSDPHERTNHLWRINRMTPARILRAIFKAPKTIPTNAGIDIERYVAFDVNGGVAYQLPSTDCSNMFVYQAIGTRIIHLEPTVECKQQCRRITVTLKQHHTLFYDWWYWKPISSPAQLTRTTSVSFIGSYCT